jgi:DNA adenine methylase
VTPTRPIVRYHGGKWMLAPWIISHFPAHRCYVEPYGGGGSVLLRKPRSHAEVYNDLDGEIVNLFRIARDRGEDLVRALMLTPFSRDEFAASYTPSEDPLEQARRTVARAFMGFGSNSHNRLTGFRSNSNRSGTTPAQDWRHFPPCLCAIAERLQGVVIENRDALEVLQIHDAPTTLHYIDPPYLAETRDAGADYRFEMDEAAHVHLAEVLRGLEGAVIVSGYPSPLYEDLYKGWTRAERPALADGAAPRTEVLWMRGIDLGLFAEAGA